MHLMIQLPAACPGQTEDLEQKHAAADVQEVRSAASTALDYTRGVLTPHQPMTDSYYNMYIAESQPVDTPKSLPDPEILLALHFLVYVILKS